MGSSIAEHNQSDDISLIVYHKSSSSGRTRFLRQQSGALCVLKPLPKLSEVLDESVDDVVVHPTLVSQKAAQWFDMAESDIEIDGEFREQVDVAGNPLTVYLARFNTIDPPFEMAEKMGAKFIAITDALDALPAELELLRRAYAVIMGD